MNKNIFHLILILLIAADLTYSFLQHYQVPLDGDLASIVVPSKHYQQVLKDPFGLSVALEDKVYAAPNRYFVHKTMVWYFRTFPQFFQHFFTPINSLFISCALAKTLIQLLILYLISFYASLTFNKFKKKEILLVVMVLIIPLFQTSGYNRMMGIIDVCITYTFFYALPLAVLLLFFKPFFQAFVIDESVKLSTITKILLLGLTIVLPFSGALIPGIILIISLLIAFYFLRKIYQNQSNKNLVFITTKAIQQTPNSVIFYFGLMSLLCLYSINIGKNNIENIGQELPILERYFLVLPGIWKLLTSKLGLGLFIILIGINTFLLQKIKNEEGYEVDKVLKIGKWIALFSILYLLLLPLGGYRWYRANIVRYDTIMPITICLFYYFGISSFFLLKSIKSKYKWRYRIFILAILILYTVADEPIKNTNICERNALEIISKSKEDIVEISSDCRLFSWDKILNPENSKTNAQFIKLMNITESEKLFYQEK